MESSPREFESPTPRLISLNLNYVTFAYWKNSGMAASIYMSLFAATLPEAVLPCVVSLIIETVWFALLTKYIDSMWPPSERDDQRIEKEVEAA